MAGEPVNAVLWRVCAAPGCAREFPYREKHARYCSSACQARAYYRAHRRSRPPPATCRAPGCGKTFAPTRVGQRYCSVNCRAAAFYARRVTEAGRVYRVRRRAA